MVPQGKIISKRLKQAEFNWVEKASEIYKIFHCLAVISPHFDVRCSTSGYVVVFCSQHVFRLSFVYL